MRSWRAGCAGTRTSGSEGGGEETTSQKLKRRLAADPTMDVPPRSSTRPLPRSVRRVLGASQHCRARDPQRLAAAPGATLVQDWAELHADELQTNWDLAQALQPLVPIEPLP